MSYTNVELIDKMSTSDYKMHLAQVNAILKEKEQINIYIASPGGDLFIYDLYQYALDRSDAKVHVVVDYANSAAALILCNADTIEFTSSKPVVFHAIQDSATRKISTKQLDYSRDLLSSLCKRILSPSHVDYIMGGHDLGVLPKVVLAGINGAPRLKDSNREYGAICVRRDKCKANQLFVERID